MEPEQSMDSLSYETTDERNRRGGESGNPKKRLNKKEQRERNDQIEKRVNQRGTYLSRKAEEEEAKHLEELNEGLRAQKKREEEAKRQSMLARREEQRQLFQDVMLKDAIGEAPTAADARLKESYEQRRTAFQQDSRKKTKPAAQNRAALLKSLAAQLNGS